MQGSYNVTQPESRATDIYRAVIGLSMKPSIEIVKDWALLAIKTK